MENPAGLVQGNSQNTPTQSIPRTSSTFPLMYHFFDTHRFGEYHPHYVEDSVKQDKLPVRSSHNVMSYTLKSPLMQNITMHKDYFSVPMEAILPENWEKFFVNPVRGDDVSIDVGPSVESFWSKVASLMSALSSSLSSLLSDDNVTNQVALQSVLRFLVIGEYFYSNGSLMASLGCHGAPYVDITEHQAYTRSWDYLFDSIIDKIISAFADETYFSMTVDGYTYKVGALYNSSEVRYVSNGSVISLRHALSLIRDNPAFSVTLINVSNTFKSNLLSAISDFDFTFVSGAVPFNLSRLWAYQLSCAHYYSNDHIDFVYSAELFRQLVGNYVQTIYGSNTGARTFVRNGIRYEYDWLSAHFCTSLFTYITNSVSSAILTDTSAQVNACLGYLSALFAFRRSLRYQDYFTGSRANPLAIGTTGVSVSNNTVDVIDVTKGIQRQRFLNAVNRIRHNIEGYLSDIFGGSEPAPDYHNPFVLAHTTDDIFGQETENTGAAQLTNDIAITTNLRSNGSRYMFEIQSDRPCIIIGITHYDLPRVYSRSIERSFFHLDRFDMFNPFMQYTGDQQIYKNELGIQGGYALTTMTNFAYTLKYMEYKQRYNQAAGGFVENLPGFAFLALDERGNQTTINPDWIRSVPSEIDDFYVSLTGYSNGSYFHFIVDTFNDCTGSRPMSYAPSIL